MDLWIRLRGPAAAVFAAAQALTTQAEATGVEVTVDQRARPVRKRGAAQLEHASKFLGIEKLNLDTRTYNILKREGVQTIGQVTACTEETVSDLRNFGDGSLTTLKERLHDPYGLQLRAIYDPGLLGQANYLQLSLDHLYFSEPAREFLATQQLVTIGDLLSSDPKQLSTRVGINYQIWGEILATIRHNDLAFQPTNAP